jgi:hypothetical protein
MKGERFISRGRLLASVMFLWPLLFGCPANAGSEWTSAGQNLQNTRYNRAESKIGVDTVGTLSVRR